MNENELKSSVSRVARYLADNGIEGRIQTLPTSTRTAREAADSLGCQLGQIAKSLIFKDLSNEQAVLVVASGSARVSLDKILQNTGLQLGKADAAFVKANVGFTIGGIPPVAHLAPIKTILDTQLKTYAFLWAAAGSANSVFRVTPMELEHLTSGQWLDVAE